MQWRQVHKASPVDGVCELPPEMPSPELRCRRKRADLGPFVGASLKFSPVSAETDAHEIFSPPPSPHSPEGESAIDASMLAAEAGGLPPRHGTTALPCTIASRRDNCSIRGLLELLPQLGCSVMRPTRGGIEHDRLRMLSSSNACCATMSMKVRLTSTTICEAVAIAEMHVATEVSASARDAG